MMPFGVAVALWYVLNFLFLAFAVNHLATALERATAADRGGIPPPGSRSWWSLRLLPILICIGPIGVALERGQADLLLLARRLYRFSSLLMIPALALLAAFPSDQHCQALAGTAALQLVGASLLALAAYVAIEAAKTIIEGEAAHTSYVGIGLAIASLIVMPLLARAKRRVAAGIDSRALVADSRQTDICAWLSAILLAGLILNAWLGWWWSDPAAGLLMVPLIAKEGVEALQGERSC